MEFAADRAPPEQPGAIRAHEAFEPPAPERLRRAFSTFATGIAVIGARSADGTLVGMTANSFTSVSLNPPLVLFCPARALSTFNAYSTAGHFSVSILPAHAEAASNHFARSGSGKWSAVPHGLSESGMPFLHPALASFECEVAARHDAGDHLIVVGRVLRLKLAHTEEPLVFFNSHYRRLEARTRSGEPEGEPPFQVWG
jgi:flavin reductase (DIM6/NTAB) family NADH-FMN oxidoreductase RutF